ncbi:MULTISPECIES: ACP S-malonyltransferase [Halomonas]|uniref:Malonyl CoA-acyl carrier protein transacylase n=2 Tax=Halomonas TaxID=2745 RepID=A0AAU7KXU0_9GAMM|nr:MULTISPECIES: ACP S-malonyltransferase [Halomonas]MBR9769736.1 ACP S-malonyltransferase [Gammaproteobacteria bacterium]KJZ11339.1 malonyl CoA-ACP transacylase [Halomonas sp. S2151]MAR70801.1 [acyl-carrier-protein] S-malonyltransferase [Halomonas sp.]MBR9878824.1 ACP S-malonyltransferase [Gammaproteobacteria bacterium]MBS8268911.1 [acyl-carrier-protein] S-malonyltransferase [Halomonas litopenaei]
MTQPLALIFPGQGSQQVGMLRDLAERYSVVRTTFEEASEALGYDLWQVVQEGPAEALNATACTQPALLASSVAIWRVWQELEGPRPGAMAGHSLGEYSAMVCAGALSFAEGVRLVRLRGEAMQQAVPAGQGAMAAILGLDDAAVEQACAKAADGDVVSAVNYNAPGQVVIAGSKAAVDRAIAACQEAGAKRAMPLPVSVPSHCDLMRPAAERLEQALGDIELKAPRYTVVQNVDAQAHADVATLRTRLIEQLYQPVRWVSCVEKMVDGGAEVFIECGPGKVLTGLNKRIARGSRGLAVNDPDSLSAALELAREIN